METTPATDKTQPISVSHTQSTPQAPVARAPLPPELCPSPQTVECFSAF